MSALDTLMCEWISDNNIRYCSNVFELEWRQGNGASHIVIVCNKII